MFVATFYTKLLTDSNGVTRRFIGVNVPGDSSIEINPGRNARKRLRRWVIEWYGPMKFRQCRNQQPIRSRLVGSWAEIDRCNS